MYFLIDYRLLLQENMKLIEINKTLYRKRLNIVIVSFIASLAICSLLFGSIFIELFGEPSQVTNTVNEISIQVGGETIEDKNSNFKYNLLGVILSLIGCGATLYLSRNSAFFKEIYYVWQLKQIHNTIYRRLKKINAAATINESQSDVNALIILKFYYDSLKQVYLLDDNTLVISALEKKAESLENTINSQNFTVSIEQFNLDLLALYK